MMEQKFMCLGCKKVMEPQNKKLTLCNCDLETFVDVDDQYLKIGGNDLSLIVQWDNQNNKWIPFRFNPRNPIRESSYKKAITKNEKTMLNYLIYRISYLKSLSSHSDSIIELQTTEKHLYRFKKILGIEEEKA